MKKNNFNHVEMLLIDNYDSFTYNLVQAFAALGAKVMVYRNDMISIKDCLALKPTHVVISPGPGRPEEAGISLDVIGAFAGRVPILGVCLGHQSIIQQQGGKIIRADKLMHGKTSDIKHDGLTIFKDIENPFEVGRYHSLCAEVSSLPKTLEISATTDDGIIMGVRHKNFQIEGVQFHPESVLTPSGEKLMKNFMLMEAK